MFYPVFKTGKEGGTSNYTKRKLGVRNNLLIKKHFIMRAIEKVLVLEKRAIGKENTGNEKWDRYLDDYNNYVKEYNKHYLNALKGDERSISLYPYMKEKWEALKKRLVKAYNNKRLSDRQIRRVVKINTKIVKAYFK
ncbi:hypothetical protein SAMN05443667_10671 [Flavobacterium gillisiae]|uniref:Uncharacterized protein n=2 Tax=Flavobacterium gillisiae TaxID=150146 RepID=A0A1H4CJT8_9FLAO|nr:hypothetical protein SAMN05443667_10671 [Flavobacterium gillisiae]